MSNERYESLRQAGWRRALTGAEQAELRAWLAAQPEARADWAAEAGLSDALRRLADAPMPSNFTARVLQEIEREATDGAPAQVGFWAAFDWRRWIPRLAAGVVAVAAVLTSMHSYTVASRVKIGQSVVALSDITPAPSPELLTDFDSIRKLGPAQGADTELLALLQ